MNTVNFDFYVVFAKAFEQAPAYSIDPTLCGNPAPLDSAKPEQPDEHETHEVKKAKPIYFVGGLWTPKYGLGPLLDAGITGAANEGRPIICLSAIAAGEEVVIIDHTPIQLVMFDQNRKMTSRNGQRLSEAATACGDSKNVGWISVAAISGRAQT